MPARRFVPIVYHWQDRRYSNERSDALGNGGCIKLLLRVMRDRTLVLVNANCLGKSLSLAVGVVVPFGGAAGGELRADGDALEEAGIGSGHVAPVEAHA